MTYDLVEFLRRQREFSQRTFGPGDRTKGIVDHIRKELVEIEESPRGLVLEEWIDVVLLAFDQCWRLGYEPDEIVDALTFKFTKNTKRKWPNWKTMPQDRAIEHDRSEE